MRFSRIFALDFWRDEFSLILSRETFLSRSSSFSFFFDVTRFIIVVVLSWAFARRRFLVVVVFLLRLIFLVNTLEMSALDALIVRRLIAIDRRIERDWKQLRVFKIELKIAFILIQIYFVWIRLYLDLKTSILRCARAAQVTCAARKKIINSNNLNYQRRQKSISTLNMIKRETLIFIDFNSLRKQFNAILQRANCASIDNILRNQTCDVIFEHQSCILEITRHLTQWTTHRKINANVHLLKNICDVNRDNTDIFFHENEIHKYDENCSSVSWCNAHIKNSLN